MRVPHQSADADTGLTYYRSRYYDPKIGRFVTEDPIGFNAGDTNWYAYVGSNPVTFTDPLGLIKVKIAGRVITVHANDPDPFPSEPHGHLYPGPEKVNVNTGEIVKGGRVVGNIGSKALSQLQKILRARGLMLQALQLQQEFDPEALKQAVERICRSLPDVCSMIREGLCEN